MSKRQYMKLAHSYVTTAIYHGDLPKLDGSIKCVDCGAEANEYDHRDYKKPFEVQPVCLSCNQLRGPGANISPAENGEKRKTLLQRFREKHDNEERNQAIKAKRKSGETLKKIGYDVGLTGEQVRKVLNKSKRRKS